MLAIAAIAAMRARTIATMIRLERLPMLTWPLMLVVFVLMVETSLWSAVTALCRDATLPLSDETTPWILEAVALTEVTLLSMWVRSVEKLPRLVETVLRLV